MWSETERFVGFAEREVAVRASSVGGQRVEIDVELRMRHRSMGLGTARRAYSGSPPVSC